MSTGFPGQNVGARGARQAPGTGFVRLRRKLVARDFECDHCGAVPDWPCVNALGYEVEDHAERVARVQPVGEGAFSQQRRDSQNNVVPADSDAMREE